MELGRMWQYARMRLAFGISAAAFAAVSMLCREFVLIRGFSAIRPANGLPVTLGLMFGPACVFIVGTLLLLLLPLLASKTGLYWKRVMRTEFA